MIIIKLIGGVGNQMFQYAFAYALARQKNCKFMTDISSFKENPQRSFGLDFFNLDYTLYKPSGNSFAYRVLKKLGIISPQNKVAVYAEPHFYFDENVFGLDFQNPVYLEGYWQSEKYFQNYREEIRSLFTPKFLSSQAQELQKEILSVTHSVSLHVRRGDYVGHPLHGGICGVDYYKRAASILEDKIKNPHYFVFSDEIDWSKQHLSFKHPVTFVELPDRLSDTEDILLMSYCRHNIIANSSFSWWGAWLNQNADKIVIAPKQQFLDPKYDTKDLIPQEWMEI